jgi:hypothetical protein
MADSCDAFSVGAKIHVIYQGSATFGVYVQQWHTDELYSMILEHEGCKASAPIDESSGETVHLGEMAAEASVVCRRFLSAPFTPA